MKEFLLIFRRDVTLAAEQSSPQQMEDRMKLWQDWMGGIAAQNKLVAQGNRLSPQGRVIKKDKMVTDGPYVETKEAVGGYTIIKAASMDEAEELSKGCPIFLMGGSLEIRMIEAM